MEIVSETNSVFRSESTISSDIPARINLQDKRKKHSMQMKAEIIGLTNESYQGKRGQVNLPLLTLLDRSEGPRLKNTVDMILTEEQSAKLPSHDSAKLAGVAVTVGITELSAGFAGRMRVKGELLTLGKVG